MRTPACLFASLLLLTACDLPSTEENKARSAEAAPERTAQRGLATRFARDTATTTATTMATTTPPQAGALVQAAAGPRVTGGNLPARQSPTPAFKSTDVARFTQPWAMTFLPDGRLLVTEKQGK